MLLEILKYILLGQVVVIELLNDDEDKEIEHHVGTDNHKWEEVNGSYIATTVFTCSTVISSEHTVFHNAIPILASWDAKESDHWITKIIEISIAWYDISFSHFWEEEYAKYSIDEENKHQKQEYVDQRADCKENGEDQSLEPFGFVNETDYTSDSQNTEDTDYLRGHSKYSDSACREIEDQDFSYWG